MASREDPDPVRKDVLVEGAGPELIADGQEEVFSYTAVERGLAKDPLALDPQVLKAAQPGLAAKA